MSDLSRELEGTTTAGTAGARAFRAYGLAGARREAASGYWTVRFVAVPVYDCLHRNGISEYQRRDGFVAVTVVPAGCQRRYKSRLTWRSRRPGRCADIRAKDAARWRRPRNRWAR